MTSSKYISDTSKEYSIYVAQNRAIPKVADGLKDGQRKALWLMRNKTDKIKTVSLSGLMISENLYLHGDVSASNTISSMAAPYLNNVCFLEGVGTFGSKLSPDAWGAPRYTYVRRNKALDEIMLTDLDIVPLMDNYDGSNQSASSFLPLIPTVLLNGISGIAVGWSTEILPHNINDLIDACIASLEEKETLLLKPSYAGYDLEVRNLGGNSWEITGKIEIIDSTYLKITELPPSVKIEKYREFLDNLEETDIIQGYTDKSTGTIQIIIKMKRGILKNYTKEQLIDLFKLKSKTTERIVVLDWNGSSIKTYESPDKLVDDFVKWRLKWFTTRYENLKAKCEDQLLFQLGLQICFENDLPSILSTLESKIELEEIIKEFTSDLNLNPNHLDRLSSLPSYRWTKESWNSCTQEILKLKSSINDYNNKINDKQELKRIYIAELKELKKKFKNF